MLPLAPRPCPAAHTRRQGVRALVWAASLVLGLWGLPGHAQALPATGEWAYDISGQAKGIPYRASATLSWQREAQRYTAQLTMRALLVGQRSQTSQGTLDAHGLHPLSFIDQGRKERRYTLDWPAQRYSVSPGDATHPLPLGSQDRLSLFLQLGSVLAQLTAPPSVGQTWSLPVLGGGGAQTWTFGWQGVETLDLPAGRQTAWRLDRAPREPGDSQISLWFAPALQFVPVRIRVREADGDAVDQRLSLVRPGP